MSDIFNSPLSVRQAKLYLPVDFLGSTVKYETEIEIRQQKEQGRDLMKSPISLGSFWSKVEKKEEGYWMQLEERLGNTPPLFETIPRRLDELVTIFGDYIEYVLSWQRDVHIISMVRRSFFMFFSNDRAKFCTRVQTILNPSFQRLLN